MGLWLEPQLVMNLTESCLWCREARLTPELLLGGFPTSHWWAFAALWWPHGPDNKKQQERQGKGALGSGLWFILPPCHSLWAAPLEIASNVTVLKRKISTLCLSVTVAQPDLHTSPHALCVDINPTSPFHGWHKCIHQTWTKLNYSIVF